MVIAVTTRIQFYLPLSVIVVKIRKDGVMGENQDSQIETFELGVLRRFGYLFQV